jgi:hypothetical protein
VRPVGFDAALGDVAVEQVHAVGLAQLADLGEQAQDRHCRVLGPVGAQVIAIRTGQRGPVLRPRTSRSGSAARVYRLTVFSDRPSRRSPGAPGRWTGGKRGHLDRSGGATGDPGGVERQPAAVVDQAAAEGKGGAP